MNIGIIGVGNLGINLLNFLSEKQHVIYVSDVDGDNVDVIKNSDVIFCCVDTNILPSNFLDIKNVMDVVEDFGISFEDEIPLYEKTFVICSTLNPGDTVNEYFLQIDCQHRMMPIQMGLITMRYD